MRGERQLRRKGGETEEGKANAEPVKEDMVNFPGVCLPGPGGPGTSSRQGAPCRATARIGQLSRQKLLDHGAARTPKVLGAGEQAGRSGGQGDVASASGGGGGPGSRSALGRGLVR